MIFFSDLEKPNKFNWVDKRVDRGRQKEGTSLKSLPPEDQDPFIFSEILFLLQREHHLSRDTQAKVLKKR